MSKIKVMFFLPMLTSGGAERVSINILNQLDRNIYDIHLVLGTLGGDAIHILPQDIEVYDLKSPRTIFSIWKLRKQINKLQPDIIFSSLNRAHIALNLSLTGMGKRPKVLMRIPSSPKLVFKYNEMGKVFKFLLEKALDNADTVIAQTPEMKEEIVHYHNVAIKKIKILINPLDIQNIDRSIIEPLKIFDNKHINIVASGRLSVEKGYDVLLNAFAIVLQKNPNFRLYIIGADYNNELKKYQEIINKHQIHNFVNFLGFQKNPYKFYQHSDLFVLSSRREGLPNTVLENLYLNKPIVATTCIPFMHTLIKDGRNGFLVPVEEVEMLSSAILRFKEIDPAYKTITFNNTSANKLFALN